MHGQKVTLFPTGNRQYKRRYYYEKSDHYDNRKLHLFFQNVLESDVLSFPSESFQHESQIPESPITGMDRVSQITSFRRKRPWLRLGSFFLAQNSPFSIRKSTHKIPSFSNAHSLFFPHKTASFPTPATASFSHRKSTHKISSFYFKQDLIKK